MVETAIGRIPLNSIAHLQMSVITQAIIAVAEAHEVSVNCGRLELTATHPICVVVSRVRISR
jgi:hypothetical protein